MLVALPSAAQPPPPLPDDLDDLLPKSDPVERFKVTIQGSQQEHIDFTFDQAPGQPCGPRAAGSLDESWQYARGKSVVMSFRLVAGRHLLIQRAGRPLGDTAFAAPGAVTRDASGSFDSLGPGGCVVFPLRTGDCGKELAVRSELRLGWSKGKLTLQHSGTATQRKNAAENCGLLQDVAFDFAQLSFTYPFLGKQRGKLSLDRIFSARKNFQVRLKHRSSGPLKALRASSPSTRR